MHYPYIIIGSSAAGVSAAMTIKRLSNEPILCISAQSPLPYNKCLLTSWCSGNISINKLWLNYPEVTFLLNNVVTHINPSEKTITTTHASGTQIIGYQKLLLALGTNPHIPQQWMPLQKHVYTFHTMADTKALLASCAHYKHALIMGSGLTGLEVAWALRQQRLKVTVVEQQPDILSALHHPQASQCIARHLRKHGINVITNTTVMPPTTPWPYHIKLGHQEIVVDCIVIATGVKPATQIAQAAGTDTHNGYITTNEFLQTSIPDIFAAGDCCLVKNRLDSSTFSPHRWTDAVLQGAIAGNNMLPATKQFYAGTLPVIQSDSLGIPLLCMGTLRYAHLSHITTTDLTYESEAYDDKGNLQGFILVGTLEKSALLRKKLIGQL